MTQMLCGWNHAVVLSSSGQCFSWGANRFGQLGLGFAGGERVEKPQRIEHLPTTVFLVFVFDCGMELEEERKRRVFE